MCLRSFQSPILAFSFFAAGLHAPACVQAQQPFIEKSPEHRVVADACLINMKQSKPASTLHDLPIPPSDYPARLECYIGEVVRRPDYDGKTRTIFIRRVLVINGETIKLKAFHDWIKKHGTTAGESGFDATLDLMREVLKDKPRSFSVDSDHRGQGSLEMPFDEFMTDYFPRYLAGPNGGNLLPGPPVESDPELKKELSIDVALSDRLVKELMKKDR